MDQDWLIRFLETAPRKYRCMTRGCTTCGGGPFRQGVLEALAEATGETAGSYREPRIALAVTESLALLSARQLGMAGLDLIFVSLQWPDGPAPELRAVLEGTPAGDYLRSMEAREAAWAVRQAERAAEWAAYMSPEAVAQRKADRRERRRLMKLPEMEARAARQAERDRLWRLRQAPES